MYLSSYDPKIDGSDNTELLRQAIFEASEKQTSLINDVDGSIYIDHMIHMPRYVTIVGQGKNSPEGNRLLFGQSGIHFNGYVNGSNNQTFNNGLKDLCVRQIDASFETPCKKIDDYTIEVEDVSRLDTQDYVTVNDSNVAYIRAVKDNQVTLHIPVAEDGLLKREYPNDFIFLTRTYSVSIEDCWFQDIRCNTGIHINTAINNNVLLDKIIMYGKGGKIGLACFGGSVHIPNIDIERFTDIQFKYNGGMVNIDWIYTEGGQASIQLYNRNTTEHNKLKIGGGFLKGSRRRIHAMNNSNCFIDPSLGSQSIG